MFTKDFHSLNLAAAKYELDIAIKLARSSKEKVLALIVGYGASGKTHKIKTEFINILNTYSLEKKIKAYILGENIDLFKKEYIDFKYKELIPVELKKRPNKGMIVVVL